MKLLRIRHITLSHGAIALALLLSVAGCSRDDKAMESTEGVIAFEDYTLRESVTRGSMVTGFEVGDSFGVYTYTTPGGVSISSSTRELIMDNREVSLDGLGFWLYEPQVKWPYPTYQTHFIAYAPYDEESIQIDTPDDGYPKFLFEMPTDCFEQHDLMAAARVYTTTNVLVSLNFEHMLSPIAFQVKGSKNRTLTGVKITGIHSAATLTCSGSDFTWGSYNTDTNTEFDVHMYWDITPGDDPTELFPVSIDNNFILALPQELPEGAAVEITYLNNEEAEPTPMTQSIALPTEVDWEAGKKYLYTITLRDQITIEIADWNWVDSSDTEDEVSDSFQIKAYEGYYTTDDDVDYTEDGFDVDGYDDESTDDSVDSTEDGFDVDDYEGSSSDNDSVDSTEDGFDVDGYDDESTDDDSVDYDGDGVNVENYTPHTPNDTI